MLVEGLGLRIRYLGQMVTESFLGIMALKYV